MHSLSKLNKELIFKLFTFIVKALSHFVPDGNIVTGIQQRFFAPTNNYHADKLKKRHGDARLYGAGVIVTCEETLSGYMKDESMIGSE